MKSVLPWLLLVGLGISWAAARAWAAEVPRADKAKAAIERGKDLLDKDEYPAAAQAPSCASVPVSPPYGLANAGKLFLIKS